MGTLKFYEMKKRTKVQKTPILNRKLIFPMFFPLHSSVKDLKSVIAEFQGGGKLGPYFTGLHGKHCPLLCTPLELNPISAGVLENRDMLGGVNLSPSPLNPMFDVQI